MAVCTPMDGHSSLLLFANIKERLVSGYVAAIMIVIVYMHGLLLTYMHDCVLTLIMNTVFLLLHFKK